MAYPNEHAARLKKPELYDRFRRQNDKFGSGIHAIWGIRGENDNEVVELQAIRFASNKRSAAEAEKWARDCHGVILFEPAVKEAESSFYLPHSSDVMSLVLDNSDGSTPSFLYRKELIRVGVFYKDDGAVEFEITQDTLNHWVDTFKAFKENGIQVPIPLSHFNTEESAGYLRDLFVNGTVLIGIIELFGDDADKLAKTKDVSIYCPVEWVDGAGNIYGRPILHVALTPYPLIPGLKGFEALAASLLVRKEKIKMEWTKIKKGLGIDVDITDENAEELILSARQGLSEKLEKLEEENKRLTDASATLKLSLVGKEPDPILVSLAADNHDLKLGALVAAARITPAVRDKLSEAFVGKDKEVLALSLKSGSTQIFDAVILALSENDPVVLQEQSGIQDLVLSDQSVVQENVLVKDANRRAEAAKV